MKRILLLLTLPILAGCATVKQAQIDMPVGAVEVTGANPRRWNQSIAFGDFRTEMVDEGTRRSWLAEVAGIQIGKADQGYHMRIAGIDVECHTREIVVGRSGVFVDPTLGGEALLACGYQKGQFTRSALALKNSGRVEPGLVGELREIGGPSYDIRSIHRAIGSKFPSSEPFGYEIVTAGGDVIASVETVNRGRVWIDPEAPNRETLAAAAASLLLFRPPDAGEVD
jgi:hypothetical protein